MKNLRNSNVQRLATVVGCAAVLLSCLLTEMAVAQEGKVAAQVRHDLEVSQKRLAEQRGKHVHERVKLSSRLTQTQAQLIELRRRVRLARMSGFDRKQEIRELEQRSAAQSNEVAYLASQLHTYWVKFTTHLVQGEKSGVMVKGKELSEQMRALEVGLSRLENVVGGAVVAAEAVDATGRLRSGKIAMVGPAMWFQSSDGEAAGAVNLSKGSHLATVVDGGNADAVAALMGGTETTMPLDLTGGKARALAALQSSPLDLVRKGGVWLLPIFVIGIVALIIAVLKFIQLSKIRNPQSGWLSGVLADLRSGDVESAIAKSEALQHPVGEVVAHAITGAESGADVVEEIVYERMIDVQSRLKKWLPIIAVTAAIAPLLGLLGTVSGMINTFNVITVAGTGDAQSLAGGISEALITTMFGLIVAIPALVIHAVLSRRSQGIIQMTEKLALSIVNSIRKQEKKS